MFLHQSDLEIEAGIRIWMMMSNAPKTMNPAPANRAIVSFSVTEALRWIAQKPLAAVVIGLLAAGCVPLATPFTTLDPPACDDPRKLIPLSHGLAREMEARLGREPYTLKGNIENPHEIDFIVSKTHWTAARVCAGRFVASTGDAFKFRWSEQEIYGGFVLLNDFRAYTGDRCIVPEGETECDVTSDLRFDLGARRVFPLD